MWRRTLSPRPCTINRVRYLSSMPLPAPKRVSHRLKPRAHHIHAHNTATTATNNNNNNTTTTTSSSSTLPRAIRIFGGTSRERASLEARLARVLPEALKQESLALCILHDSFIHNSAVTEANVSAEQSLALAKSLQQQQANLSLSQQQHQQQHSLQSRSPSLASSPLAESLLHCNLQGVILPIFSASFKEVKWLENIHGKEVLSSWGKDLLRRHLSSMGAKIAQPGLILEPIMLDLGVDGNYNNNGNNDMNMNGGLYAEDEDMMEEDDNGENDKTLLKALTQKRALVTHASQPGSLVPPKYLQTEGEGEGGAIDDKRVVLVFPRRETRSSEALHRVERLLLDYCRKNLVPIQVYYLALELAYSKEPSLREGEARRFQQMARALPKGSLLLCEDAAIEALVEWTSGIAGATSGGAGAGAGAGAAGSEAAGQGGEGTVDISTFYLSLLNYFFCTPSDIIAGSHVFNHLGPHHRILITDDGHHHQQHHHHQYLQHPFSTTNGTNTNAHTSTMHTSAAVPPEVQRGYKVAAALERQFLNVLGNRQELVPKIECGNLDSVHDLNGVSMVVIHSGNYSIDPAIYKKRLELCKEAGVAVSTPALFKAWLKEPRTLARLLKPWPCSFTNTTYHHHTDTLSPEEEAAALAAAAAVVEAGGDSPAGGAVAAAEVAGKTVEEKTKDWEHGFRHRHGVHMCSDCTSWSCNSCTKKQKEYAGRVGETHVVHGMGTEWRDSY